MVQEKLQRAARTVLNSVLEAEVEAFNGQRYEHSEQRHDYRNGHYMRGLDVSLGRMSDLAELRTQAGYQTQLFERSHRRDRGMDQTLGEMFIGGVNLAWVGELVDTLIGAKP